MSAAKGQQAPVVAELGRPETPAETAARKAESSANHRNRQTINNLVYSLLATLAIVAVIVLMVPQTTPATTRNVDYTKIAHEGAGSEPDALLAPNVPASWSSNSAQLRTDTEDKVDSWYIGFITGSKQYIGFEQGFRANDTWLASQVSNSTAKTTATIDGRTWTVYDNRHTSRDVGDVKYALSTTYDQSTIVLYGTGSTGDFSSLARRVGASIDASGATS